MLMKALDRIDADLGGVLQQINSGRAAASELRSALGAFKSISAKLAAAQTRAAATIAAAERHGDGGTGVLRTHAGLSRREAAGRVKTADTLQTMPSVLNEVETGRVSFANAAELAKAGDKTSADAVQADTALLDKARSMPEDQFAREARRWTAQHQADGGEADYARCRAKRSVRMWKGDDGMTHLRGEFDPETGARIRSRLEAEALSQYRADKKQAGAGETRRTFDQCRADALEHLIAAGSAGGGKSAGRVRSVADIVISATVSDDPEHPVAGGEIVGTGPIPQSVLERMLCNASVTGVLFSGNGKALWCGRTRYRPTDGQMKALIERDGGCVGCGADPSRCEAHHIDPWARGGRTDIDNLVLLCWYCHRKVHHNDWQVTHRHGRLTIEPPERVAHGPARAPELPHRAGSPLTHRGARTRPTHDPAGDVYRSSRAQQQRQRAAPDPDPECRSEKPLPERRQNNTLFAFGPSP